MWGTKAPQKTVPSVPPTVDDAPVSLGFGRVTQRHRCGCDGIGGRSRYVICPMDSARVAAYSAGTAPPAALGRGRDEEDRMRIAMGRRIVRSLTAGALVGSVLTGAGALPAAAGVPVGTYFEGAARQPVVGLPGMTLSMYASDLGGPTGNLGLVLRKANAAKSAWAEDQWAVAGDVGCTIKLGSCTIDDTGNLGTYGRIDLTFSATKAATKHDLVCFGSDVVYAKQLRRTGVLTGTLRLSTKSTKLGTIRNGVGAHRVKATIPITMRRTTYTGAACPATTACEPAAWLNGQSYRATGFRRLPTGRGRTGYVRDVASAVPEVERTWYVYADGAGAAALSLSTATTLAAASLGTDLSAPFVTGTATFDATAAKTSTTHLGCDAESRTGELDVHLTWHMPGRAKVQQVGVLPAELIRTTS